MLADLSIAICSSLSDGSTSIGQCGSSQSGWLNLDVDVYVDVFVNVYVDVYVNIDVDVDVDEDVDGSPVYLW